MGGFILSHDGQLRHPLNPSSISLLIRGDYIDISITENEINDKSKGDMISKGLVVLQTTWFALQFIARSVQRLPVTELEIVTLAFVTLNLATYVLWWKKPLNVQCAVPVVLKRHIDDDAHGWLKARIRLDGGNDTEVGNEGNIGWLVKGRETLGKMFAEIQDSLRMIGRFATASQDEHVDLTATKRVPTFYAGPLGNWGETDKNANLAFAAVGVIFGAIHCIAWSASFPSHMEQNLWRVSCGVIMGVPGLYFMIYRGVASTIDDLPDLQPLMQVIMPPLIFVYLIARIALFVLAFMSLRSPPPGAFESVHWTTLIPHI